MDHEGIEENADAPSPERSISGADGSESPGGHGNDDVDDNVATRTAAMRLESAPSPGPFFPGLTLQIPNPFDHAEAAQDEIEDEEMPTATSAPGTGSTLRA